MITFLIIVICVLAVACLVMYFAIRDYKDSAITDDKAFTMLSNRADVFIRASRSRGQLLRDISNALYYGNDLREKYVLEFYEQLWNIIQDDINKELKPKA